MDRNELRRVETALSPVGLGCNNFGMKLDASASSEVVHAALDAGVTHFDTAEMYGQGRSEEFLGAALGGRRDEAFVATKFSPRPTDEPFLPGALARRIREACEGSLRRLGTDHVDLYYQHYPDPDAPLEELTTAMDELVAEGKVRHTGLSNVDAGQLDASRDGYLVAQVEWNLLQRDVEADLVPAAARRGIGIVPYFPLASGLLTGKYRKGEEFPEGSRLASMPYFAAVASDDNLDRVERLLAFAEREGHTLLELAVAWLLVQPDVVSVIGGATSPTQVAANAAAAGWALRPEQLDQIEQLLDPSV
jgi:aryl-alcohol dehydrogenase-like predicted oxidoreductase